MDWDLANPLLRRPEQASSGVPSPVDARRPLPLGPSQRPEEAEQDPALARLWEAAARVTDPEVPVLSLVDLGVLRDAYLREGWAVLVITPTYSGCPAMSTMAADLQHAARAAGFEKVWVEQVLRPAWTTDWMSAQGRARLEEYGIAPPRGSVPVRTGPVPVALGVKCPHCGSLATREMTRYGSTSCKALWTCSSCLEPFDYFKVH